MSRPRRRLTKPALALLFALLACPISLHAAEGAPNQAAAGAAGGVDAPSGSGEAAALNPFRAQDVEEAARALAEKPYENPDKLLPDYLRTLTKEQWDSIRCRAGAVLWNNAGLPFEVSLYPPGFIYDRAVVLNIVEDGQSKRLPCAADMFETSDEALAKLLRDSPPGFAGFCVRYAFDGPDGRKNMEPLADFLGATYFQAVGRHSRRGVSARGLALDTALPDGEEFPYFREFWLQKPSPDDPSLVIHALMDSPSLTGAFRAEIIPGTSTVVNVEAKFFLRQGAKLPKKIGIAPLTSMFLYSETENGKPGDYRPEVHNSDGLLYVGGDGRWVWNPLTNPARLTVNSFAMTNPRGFGLLQRDDNFDHYQDLTTRYDRSASLWVEPVGDWGAGRVELIELPCSSEYNGNITAFWVPEATDGKTPAAGAQGTPPPASAGTAEALPLLSPKYRLYWMTPGACPHDLGRATDTRMVKSPNNDAVTFIIDFAGEDLNAIRPDTGLTSVVEAPEQAPVLDKQLVKNPVTGGWRLTVKFRLPQEGMVQSLLSARDGPPRLRFSAFLKKGENLSEPLTETWVYDLTP